MNNIERASPLVESDTSEGGQVPSFWSTSSAPTLPMNDVASTVTENVGPAKDAVSDQRHPVSAKTNQLDHSNQLLADGHDPAKIMAESDLLIRAIAPSKTQVPLYRSTSSAPTIPMNDVASAVTENVVLADDTVSEQRHLASAKMYQLDHSIQIDVLSKREPRQARTVASQPNDVAKAAADSVDHAMSPNPVFSVSPRAERVGADESWHGLHSTPPLYQFSLLYNRLSTANYIGDSVSASSLQRRLQKGRKRLKFDLPKVASICTVILAAVLIALRSNDALLDITTLRLLQLSFASLAEFLAKQTSVAINKLTKATAAVLEPVKGVRVCKPACGSVNDSFFLSESATMSVADSESVSRSAAVSESANESVPEFWRGSATEFESASGLATVAAFLLMVIYEIVGALLVTFKPAIEPITESTRGSVTELITASGSVTVPDAVRIATAESVSASTAQVGSVDESRHGTRSDPPWPPGTTLDQVEFDNFITRGIPVLSLYPSASNNNTQPFTLEPRQVRTAALQLNDIAEVRDTAPDRRH